MHEVGLSVEPREGYARTAARARDRGHVPWCDGLVEGARVLEHCAIAPHSHTTGLSPPTVHHTHGPTLDNNHATVLYTPRGSSCVPSTNGVAAQGSWCALGVMVLWDVCGWMKRGALGRICAHFRPCLSPWTCPMVRWVGRMRPYCRTLCGPSHIRTTGLSPLTVQHQCR